MADIAELGFRLDTRDLARGKGALDELSRSAERTAANMVAMTVGVGSLSAAMYDANRVLREFSREMSALGAVLGGASEQMAQLREQAKVMGATTKFGAQQAAEAQKNLAQAGLSVQQIMAATPKVLNLASAGNLELAQSAEFLVDVMSQANLTVADFGRISDVAVKAANLSTTSVAQLSQGYKYAMANGALLGMSIEEVTSALAVLAQAGLKAEQGGTGLRGIASRFMQPSKEMTKTLKENSISVNDLNIAARGLAPVLDTIAKSTLSIPELMELFGQEASSAGLALVKSRQQFIDWANELKNANNTTNQVAKDMSNNLDAAFKSVRSAVEGAYIAISDATGYEKWLQNALNFSSGVINSLSGMNDSAVKAGLMAKQMAAEYKEAGETVKEVAGVIAAVVVSKLTGAAVSALSSYTTATLATIAANRNAAIAALEKATADNAVAVGTARRALVEKDAAMITLQRAQADVVAARNAMMVATTDAEKTIAAQRLAAAEYQRTQATGAAALASQKLSQSNAAATATTTALAAAQRTATATTTAAGVAARTFGGIIGALGGPIGIAITALIGLAFYWDEIKTKAFGAAESAESAANRIKNALASSNIAAANAGLDSLRASRTTIEKELGRVDAILKNESGLSALDVSKLTQQRQQLSQESEKVRSEILKSEVEIRKAKEGQAKQAVELVNGYASPLEKRLGLIKTETQEIAKAMEFKPPASKPDSGDDADKKKKDKEAAKAAKELASEQAKLNDLLQKGEGFSATYAEKLALLTKHQSKIPVDEYRAAVEKLILTETEAGKTAAKHAEEVAKLQEQFAVDDAKRTQNLQWQAEELALQASLIGKSSTEQAYLVAAFEAEKEIRSQIIDLTQEQAKYEREGNKWAVDAIDERIAKLQDEAQARKDAAGTLAAQKAVLSGWQSVSSDIERALTDSLMRGFENGENFVDSLKNYIKNAFKSFSVKLLLQPVMGAINSIGGPIYSQMMGGQSQQGQGGGFDLGKMFSDSKSSYDSFIDTGLKSSVGQSLGFSTPLTYTDAWAAGQNVSGATVSAGAELTSLGEAASTAGQALGYLPAVMHAAEGRYISTVGSAVGQYFGGPIGSVAGAAIGGLLDDAFGFGDKKPDERRARFGYGASEALVSEGKQTGWTGQSSFGTFRTYADKWFSDSEMRPAMSAFVDSLESLDNTVADSLKLTADQTANAIDALKAIDKEYSFGLQWGDFTQNSKAREQIAIDRYSTILDSVESGWGDFVRDFAGSFDQFPAYLQSIIQAMQQFRDAGGDVTRVFGQQINSIKEFERFAKSGETSAAAFQRLYGVFQITNRVLESLGKSAKGANLATADLRESFVRLAGGMEQLQGYLTEYYDGFYTEAERTAVVMADLQKEFDKYGATVPKTREEWHKLMKSLDLSTDFGQQAAVKLYQLQGAFLSVTKSTDELRQEQQQAADDAKRAADQAREDALRAQQEAEDAARQAVEDARQQVEEAYNREADAIRTTIDRLEDFIKSVRDFRDSLYLDSELSTLSKYDQYQFARQKFEEVQAKAMAGDPEALAQLEQSSRDFLEYSKAYNANNLQYQQDFDRVQSILNSAQATAQSQLSAEQAQLSALNQMVSGILQVNDSVMSLSQAIANYNAAMMALQTAKASAAAGGGVGGKVGGSSGGAGGGTYTAGSNGLTYTDFMGNVVPVQEGQSKLFWETVAQAGTGAVGSLTELKNKLEALGKQDVWQNFASQLQGNTGSFDGVSYPTITDSSGGLILVSGGRNPDWSDAQNQAQINSWFENNYVQPTTEQQQSAVNSGVSQSVVNDYVQSNMSDPMAIYNAAIANGASSAQVAAAGVWSQAEINAWADANGIARFADGGMHTGGLRLVGENGPELEVTGPSRIYNASQTQSILSSMTQSYGTSDKAALIDEIKALRQEVATLRSQMATAHQQDLRQREAIAEQSAQLSGNMTRTIQRTVTLNI